MPQPESGLPSVHSGTEQLELKNRLQLAKLSRNVAIEAQSALPHAGIKISVFTKLVLKGGQFARPHRVKPVRVVLLEIVAAINHGKARYIQVGLGRCVRIRRSVLRPDR